jgi:hypothetical protein
MAKTLSRSYFQVEAHKLIIIMACWNPCHPPRYFYLSHSHQPFDDPCRALHHIMSKNQAAWLTETKKKHQPVDRPPAPASQPVALLSLWRLGQMGFYSYQPHRLSPARMHVFWWPGLDQAGTRDGASSTSSVNNSSSQINLTKLRRSCVDHISWSSAIWVRCLLLVCGRILCDCIPDKRRLCGLWVRHSSRGGGPGIARYVPRHTLGRLKIWFETL